MNNQIEFTRAYSTPLAQRQSELEQMIKFYEIQRAKSVSGLLYGIAVGFGYVFLMGVVVGQSLIVGGSLAFFTISFTIAGWLITPYTKRAEPDLKKKHADWIK